MTILGPRGYRYELIVLSLVALAMLPVVELTSPQDRTRYELTRHLVLRGTLTVERGLFDRAVYDGRSYSDKAPGMSFLAVPAYEVERLLGVARAPVDWALKGDMSLWGIHVATSGIVFLLLVALVGRVAEALVAGGGAVTAATAGAGTLLGPLAPTFFEHDAAAFFAFAGFVLAWRGRDTTRLLALAGLALGVAVLFQYATALVALAVLVYAAAQVGRRAAWLVLGALPPALALGAYDWLAFGSPFHLSYRYVANRYSEAQRGGFFGVGVPTFGSIRDTLFVDRGLFVFSPVLIAAALGLWLMARRGLRAEATLAGFVTVAFLWLDAGYFLPYGGNSPGPRFLAPAIPFLALGLPFAFARFGRTTLALAALSVALTTGNAVTWSARAENDRWYPGHRFSDLAVTVWSVLGLNRIPAAGILLLCGLAALAVGALRGRAAPA
jgi:hypothetical protein